MATNKTIGDNSRKGAVKKRTQVKTKILGEEHWTKRSKDSGQFMDQKKKESSRASGGSKWLAFPKVQQDVPTSRQLTASSVSARAMMPLPAIDPPRPTFEYQ